MRLKTYLIIFALFFTAVLPVRGQTIWGSAAGDFYSAFAKMVIAGVRMNSLEDLSPYIPGQAIQRIEEDFMYRVAFIAFATNQLGVISGVTSSVGFAETLNAITGFLMVIEEGGEIEEWTVPEITNRYEQLLASSWRNANSPLFIEMLRAYCTYKREELWR